ncbi:M15 family metallopeptidase [Streptomyces sp. NPDC004667]|uniref:M15 family metallopeptidase n=1 Tax=Streptomyces sp. NPDC004667 TaxID=3154285 RepID=UPI0033B45934
MAPEEFVSLTDIDPTIRTDIRFATANNFVGTPLNGYTSPLCLLTRTAAQGLSRAQAALSATGHALLVLDGYRPTRAVAHVTRWARDPDDQRMKSEFFPHTAKERLFTDGYLYEWSGHSRGSTVDVTLVTSEGAQLDMGTPYGRFDARSRTVHPQIRGAQRLHRALLKDTMERAGFVNSSAEWWHYTFGAEPFPDVYFDFPVSAESLHRTAGRAPGASPVIPAQRSGD